MTPEELLKFIEELRKNKIPKATLIPEGTEVYWRIVESAEHK